MPSTKKRTPKKSPASKRGKNSLPYGGPEDPELDGQGRIRQWSSTCQDGHDLKTYIEHGCDEGLGMELLKEKFPQFKKYNPSTFSSAVQNARKSINAQVRNRKQVACKYIIFFTFISLSYLTNIFDIPNLNINSQRPISVHQL